jgi:cysteinyl-tRNA synthetase
VIELVVKKINIGQSNSSEESLSNYSNYPSVQTDIYEGTDPMFGGVSDSDVYRISPQKIAELLELRNKARRELNFSEADRIRNYLRSCGVCLIDEKGRRGKAAEVTTWKYLY